MEDDWVWDFMRNKDTQNNLLIHLFHMLYPMNTLLPFVPCLHSLYNALVSGSMGKSWRFRRMIQRTGEVLPLSRPLNNDSYLCIYDPDVLFDGWLHEEDNTLLTVNWRATEVNRVRRGNRHSNCLFRGVLWRSW